MSTITTDLLAACHIGRHGTSTGGNPLAKDTSGMNPLDDPAAFEEGKQYSIRPTERANRDVEAELERLSRWNGSEQDPTPQESIRLALEWLRAYQEARASLCQLPLAVSLPPSQARGEFGAGSARLVRSTSKAGTFRP